MTENSECRNNLKIACKHPPRWWITFEDPDNDAGGLPRAPLSEPVFEHGALEKEMRTFEIPDVCLVLSVRYCMVSSSQIVTPSSKHARRRAHDQLRKLVSRAGNTGYTWKHADRYECSHLTRVRQSVLSRIVHKPLPACPLLRQ
jgi:hypothetical protein